MKAIQKYYKISKLNDFKIFFLRFIYQKIKILNKTNSSIIKIKCILYIVKL